MRIEVREEHIDQGEPGRFRGCPIALALLEATGRIWCVSAVCATPDDQSLVLALPPEAQEFVATFDHGPGSVKPFAFDLPIKEPSNAKTS